MPEIKVDKGFLDLRGARIAFSFDGLDLRTLSRRKGDFSIDFEIPDTTENRKKLDLAANDFLDGTDTYQKIPASIVSQGLNVRQGYLKITAKRGGIIDAVFFGGNADWIDQLSGSIRDVDISESDHPFTAAVINGIWATSTPNERYTYPLIDYGVLANRSVNPLEATIINHYDVGDGQTEMETSAAHNFKLYDLVDIEAHNIAEYNGVFEIIGITTTTRFTIAVPYNSTASSGTIKAFSPAPLEYKNLRPAVYVKYLLTVMFREIGWKLSGEVMDDFWFSKLIIPFSLAELAHSYDFAEDVRLTASKDVRQTQSTEIVLTNPIAFWNNIQDVGGHWDGLQYTPDANLILEISASIYISSVSFPGSTYATLSIARDNAGTWDIISDEVIISAAGPYSINFTYRNQSDTNDICIAITTYGALAQPAVVSIDYGNVTIEAPDVEFGSTIQIAETLPDITKIEFIRYIFNHKAIVPIAEPYGKTLELRFFKTIKYDTAEDWTAKISSKTTDFSTIFEGYGKKTWFRYKTNDKDEILIAYQNQFGKAWGDGYLEIDNDFIENEKDIYQAPFAGTVNYFSMKGGAYLPYIPVSANKIDFTETQEPGFRILYVLEGLGLDFFIGAGQLKISAGTSSLADVSQATWAFFTKTDIGTYLDNLLDESLAFDTPDGQTSRGLLERYYGDINGIIQRGKIENFQVKVNAADVANWSQGVPIFIFNKGGGKLYFRNKILNFDPDEQFQTVELIPYG